MQNRLPLAISIAALAVAVLGSTPLGQAAYDAVVPVNSVGTPQLRNLSVTAPKIRGDAVDSGKVKNRSLKAIDFAAGQLPVGATGAKGDKGDRGAPGATSVVTRWSTVLNGNNNTFGGRLAKCNTGEVAVGGGGGWTSDTGSTGAVTLVDSKPVPNTDGGTPTGWFAGLRFSATASAAAYVICAKP